jgi:L-seryl-tRNA(Ser) seleniumtransferase
MSAAGGDREDVRRGLPSVDKLLRDPGVAALLVEAPRNVVVAAAREAVDRARRRRAGPPDDWAEEIRELVARRIAPSLRPVLNATGVVLHTNLGRAPLADVAVQAASAVARGYSTLEYDLSTGTRGSRADHCRTLLRTLTATEGALAVNNAAGALLLGLAAHARGREVLISRGELIEIGGSFRIPDILERSGARLREVGTTNRTHLDDYRRAAGPDTGAILTVHRSNFEQRGFVASPEPAELAALARELGVPYLYDVGSGLLADLAPWGLTGEPTVAGAVASGADLVLFSGDKLLGGPQAGCMVGGAQIVAACARDPLARALRADKMTLAALEATLALYLDPDRARDEIPVLRMLTMAPESLARRAEAIRARCPASVGAELVPGESAVGGGSFPTAAMPTTLVALTAAHGAESFALRLRLVELPVIARVADGRVLLDPRTLGEDELDAVASAIAAVVTSYEEPRS